MPVLTWPAKALPQLQPSPLHLDSVTFPRGLGYPGLPPQGSLFLGDNLDIMTSLLPEYEGRVHLVYADPPFFTNKNYPTRIGRGEDSRRPADWRLVEGYADAWKDLDSYLSFLYPRLALMTRLLSPNGVLVLHLDWHADAYARLLLDELIGRANLVNEIIWVYHGPSPIRRAFNRKHDTLLVYARGPNYRFNTDAVREPYHPSTIKTFGSSPRAGFGKVPNLEQGKVPEDWWYNPVVARLHKERTGYPTQKPEALLERLLFAFSDPGDLVADFFCGSGTFPLVAARHGRDFLAGDGSFQALHTTRSRLVTTASAPFSISSSREHIPSAGLSPLAFSLSSPPGSIQVLPNGLDLDYWELDPAWDGKVFHSVVQARRPNRSAAIPLESELPVVPGKVRLRAVTVDGRFLEGS